MKKSNITLKSLILYLQIYCVELDTVYESIQECARQLNLYATNISKVCKGQRLKTTGGYHFQYATKEQTHILLNA